jgi:hypothetical protein
MYRSARCGTAALAPHPDHAEGWLEAIVMPVFSTCTQEHRQLAKEGGNHAKRSDREAEKDNRVFMGR